jgi:hypothetical protein
MYDTIEEAASRTERKYDILKWSVLKPPRKRRRNASGRDFTGILCDTLTDKAHLPVIPHILPQLRLKALLISL